MRKPDTCKGCPLYEKGEGFSLPVGPPGALTFIGEALGEEEAKAGTPFVGKAGAILNRILRRLGLARDEIRIHNIISCRPPDNKLVGEPYEKEAIAHCSQYLNPVLSEGSRAVVALGATATKVLLGLSNERHEQENWHGCPTESPRVPGQYIVSTFHPAYLLPDRGGMSLFGTVCFDIRRAKEIYDSGAWVGEPAELIIDPDPEWFRGWAERTVQEGLDFACDIETPDKEGRAEDDSKDLSWEITRINFSSDPNIGITVPYLPPYLDAIELLLSSGNRKIFWFKHYDVPRLKAKGHKLVHPIHDAMDAWHVLQSDTPRGLGFVAPFISKYGAWKHLSKTDPTKYAAIDGFQTLRIWINIVESLKKLGMWEVYERHIYQLDRDVLEPAMEAGLHLDQSALNQFETDLREQAALELQTLRDLFPLPLRREHPKDGWKKPPSEDEFIVKVGNHEYPFTKKDLAYRPCYREVLNCKSCGAIEIQLRHRCKDKKQEPRVVKEWTNVSRSFVTLPFNPSSDDQIRQYFAFKGTILKGKKTKTGKIGVDKKTLQKLAAKDPFAKHILEHRQINKILSTYVMGSKQRLKEDGKLHTTFTHKPSTMRLSSVNPNLQNIVSSRGGGDLALRFRKCIVPAPGNVFLEVDYNAIEAVVTGWCAGDPQYIRLAKLGVHAYLASHMIGKPADLSWPDEKLKAYFKFIKKDHPKDYDIAKHCVHGTNYGLTPYGMTKYFPETFTSLAIAEQIQRLYLSICPALKKWQDTMILLATKQDYIGGKNNHPFGYKHWFWDAGYVNDQGLVVKGTDANRVIATPPQGIAAGILYETCLRLSDRGNLSGWLGSPSPIRALIHDSVLFEFPESQLQVMHPKILGEFTKPILQLPCPKEWGMGEHIIIGASAKLGKNWRDMVDIEPDDIVQDSTIVMEDEEEAA